MTIIHILIGVFILIRCISNRNTDFTHQVFINILYIYSSSPPSFYFLIGKPSENGAYSHGASVR